MLGQEDLRRLKSMGCKKLLHRVRGIEKELKEEKFKKEKRKRYLKKCIILLVIALIAAGIYFFITWRLKGIKYVYDPVEIILEVSGINSNGPVSSAIIIAPAQKKGI